MLIEVDLQGVGAVEEVEAEGWCEVVVEADLGVEWEVDHQEWEVEVVLLVEAVEVDIFLQGIYNSLLVDFTFQMYSVFL